MHFEIIESLGTSSFINVLCQFLALRDPGEQFSFQNKPFLGACMEQNMLSNETAMKNDFSNQYCHRILIPWVTSSYGRNLGQTNWSGMMNMTP